MPVGGGPGNRQPSEAVLVDPANTGLGHKQVQRWNLPEGWVISKHPAHAALVSEAGFIAAQDTTAPRGPAGPAVRQYLLAGLIACGRCGRRLESAWSNGKPAYRCRHGYSSATVPDLARPTNTYVREDQILPHLAALAILLADGGTPGRARQVNITAPAGIADLIDQLRGTGAVLTYDPDTKTIRAGDGAAVAITVGRRSLKRPYPARTTGRRREEGNEHPPRLKAGPGRRSRMPGNSRSWGFNVSESHQVRTGTYIPAITGELVLMRQR